MLQSDSLVDGVMSNSEINLVKKGTQQCLVRMAMLPASWGAVACKEEYTYTFKDVEL